MSEIETMICPVDLHEKLKQMTRAAWAGCSSVPKVRNTSSSLRLKGKDHGYLYEVRDYVFV